ncbi:MAG: M56 family metallopeptidase [Gemmatimonas sp.]|uniref:M56 family metallopeptidase n=1 Tax=Gemmatimonas sp. TaxID=1962908 RepID=UPI00391F4249
MTDSARPWLRAGTVHGERRYQRLLVIGLAAILLLSLVPVVGTHVLGLADRPLSGSDHFGVMCLIALHELLAPVHQLLHVLVVVGGAWALWDLAQRAWQTRRVLQGLPMRRLSAAEAMVAAQAGLPAAAVHVVHGLPIPAFTAGHGLRPRVYVAHALLQGAEALPAEELTAVLAHEAAHVRRRDPLRFLLLRTLARALFWVPAVRTVSEDIADEAEVIADDAASAVAGPIAVASALVKLGAWPQREAPVAGPLAVVGFLRRDLLDRRVRRLLGEAYRPQGRLTTRAVAVALLMLSVSTLSGIVDVHDLPAAAGHPASHQHCEHDGVFAAAHLFCRWQVKGPLLPPGASDCPHRHA